MAPPKNWDTFYRRIYFIFNGIIALSLIPFALLFLELEKGEGYQPLLNGHMLTVSFIIFTFLMSYLVWIATRMADQQVSTIESSSSLGEKLHRYLMIQTRKYLLMEGAAAIGVVALIVTTNYWFVFLYVLILFIFSLGKPTYDKIVQQLRLTKDEKEIIMAKRDFE
ncbi:MAG: hypothetical protein KI790_15645 [Cyclobacteriaceae bacterium]|nr:hypothetical protein [Cyclobacteriaceae bacterium HetDA_MAG_MS6]